jgi:hypothetical protein
MAEKKEIASNYPRRKTPKHLVERRKAEIMQMIIQGASLREVWKYVDEKTDWGVSERTVRRYYKAAEKDFIKSANIDVEKELGKALERLNYLFARTVHLQDYKGALAVQREINELLGLKTLKIQLIAPEHEMSIEEIEARIEEIERSGIRKLGPGTYLNTNTE